MRLQQWKANGWLQSHQTTPAQIADLLAIVDRDLEDSKRDLSPDWQFGIAYNAALKLCTILLYASGYRPEKNLAHYRTLAALPLILGNERKDDADYLDTCRAKRNTAEYDTAGTVSQSEADELREYNKELRADVTAWLKANHPTLITDQ
ncbi:MAG: hypothetical protein EAZ65_04865 [Verrucomicrobia bacterium]|nr:MAG: hypothetical protein EAZ84_01590 [Verrucomicrobiota bacterium]TAE87462.1 MAG: hypothetical protein EAZ82_07230 [Verrucomicrobiota bacterium]TAF25745.1 MAG: hypothetical protein EAZ71_06215 [Verrucomicrobiota bacterium]TAF41532.1 MAG: hypothetical protein EAZ65_04865 [Verrucomicrobiota bacterium]